MATVLAVLAELRAQNQLLQEQLKVSTSMLAAKQVQLGANLVSGSGLNVLGQRGSASDRLAALRAEMGQPSPKPGNGFLGSPAQASGDAATTSANANPTDIGGVMERLVTLLQRGQACAGAGEGVLRALEMDSASGRTTFAKGFVAIQRLGTILKTNFGNVSEVVKANAREHPAGLASELAIADAPLTTYAQMMMPLCKEVEAAYSAKAVSTALDLMASGRQAEAVDLRHLFLWTLEQVEWNRES